MFKSLRSAGFRLIRRWPHSSIAARPCTSSAYKPIKRPSFPSSNDATPKSSAPNETLDRAVPALAERLRMRIQAAGPITLAQYMKEVLTNSSGGYYTSSKPVIGARGDFVTSPEIGQIFGELIAVWLYAEWQKCGSPRPVQLVELGPGRGTMIQDVVRVLARFGMTQHVSVHLVEISRFLSDVQAQRLCLQSNVVDGAASDERHYRTGATVSGIPVRWYERLEDVPAGFSIVLAHEFFDALPVHKFQRQDGEWREVLVDYDAQTGFRLVAATAETVMLKLFRQQVLDVHERRTHIEHSFEAHAIVEHLAERLERDGGFALIMDYGHTGDGTDTFRAFRAHRQVDALSEPGASDLTADVDFAHLRRVCERRLVTFGPVAQGQFIERCGGRERLQQLIDGTECPDVKQNLASGYRMLTDAQQMGERFKFMAAFPAVLREHLARFPVNGFS